MTFEPRTEYDRTLTSSIGRLRTAARNRQERGNRASAWRITGLPTQQAQSFLLASRRTILASVDG
jgi:hypothetical protein